MTHVIAITINPAMPDTEVHRLLSHAQLLADAGLDVQVTQNFREVPADTAIKVCVAGCMRRGDVFIEVPLHESENKPNNATTAGWRKQIRVRERWRLKPRSNSSPYRDGSQLFAQTAVPPVCTGQAGCSPCLAQRLSQVELALRCMQQGVAHPQPALCSGRLSENPQSVFWS